MSLQFSRSSSRGKGDENFLQANRCLPEKDLGLEPVVSAVGCAIGVVYRAAAGGGRLQVLGKPNLAPDEHQRLVPDLGTGHGLRQLARRREQADAGRFRERAGTPASEPTDRCRAQGTEEAIQERTYHPQNVEPLSRAP
ncbi:hypothetical protein D3C87_1684300 [compost metagenome]